MKFRRDRRPSFPIEPAWLFYPRYVWDTASKLIKLFATGLGLAKARYRIRRDPNHRLYTDVALTSVSEDETESLEMFTHSDGARDAVAHARKVDALTHAKRAHADAQPN